jgi:4a-hydroxytetrahydrobiopterin dehydratase
VAALDNATVMQHLRTMQQWAYESGQLSRRFRFKDFADAFGFVACAAAVQQEMHQYGSVTQEGPIVLVDLWTETEHGVTERDLELARQLSARAYGAM